VKILTTRFGEIDVDESRVIEMRGGILGFEHLSKYIMRIRDEKTPFLWLQSVDDCAVAFVIINPQIVKQDYAPVIGDDDVALLEIESIEDVVLMAIVTIRSNPLKVSANLRAPIVINSRKRLAKQIVLDDPEYPVQYYLTPDGPLDTKEGIEKDCDRNGVCGAAVV
jgi:flagellar assembly factor FliW